MARILIAWELGTNFGHLTRQLPIARRLRSEGHQLLFAVREVAAAEAILAPHGFRYVQAPINMARLRLRRPPSNYSELLLAEGYGSRIALRSRLQAWISLMKLLRAEVVMIDHAPTARLASWAIGLPSIQVGNGFEIPPDRSPLPTIRPWQTASEAQLLRSDQLVVDCINECLQGIPGARSLASIADLFSRQPHVLATFRELDHYGPRGTVEYSGPLFADVGAPRVQWMSKESPRILAYLRNGTPGLKNLLAALKRSDAEVICAMPGISARLSRAISNPRFQAFPHGVQFESLIPEADAVVAHGGSGTSSQALLAGVPVMSVPANVEQYLQGQRIEALEAGITLGSERSEDGNFTALNRLLSERRYKQGAAAFAHRYAGFQRSQPVDRAVSLIEQMTARGSAPMH